MPHTSAPVAAPVDHVAAPRRRWLFAVASLGVWSMLGLIAAVQSYTSMRLEGEPISWARALIGQLPGWYFWALATPLVVVLSRRAPPTGDARGRAAAVHLGAAVALSAAHALTIVLLRVLVVPGDPPPLTTDVVLRYLSGYLLFDMVIYLAVLGVTLALAYAGEARERERRAARLEAQLAQAQLQALRMQLHPHFLFNALNSVAMLVREGDGVAAVRMLAGLSDLLRQALDGAAAHEITLRDELAFVERYLAIEQVRFQDRLRVTWDIEPAALDARVPNLVLQPLVENAIRHGLARRAAAGLVAIGARRAGGSLVLTVRDDGPGLDDGAPAIGATGGGGGVGLANTRARLAQLHGAAASLDLRPADGDAGGAEAVVVMPWSRGDALPEGEWSAGAPPAYVARSDAAVPVP